MYKRIFTSLTIAFAMAGAAFTGTATARQLQESGAWAVPSSTQTGVVSKPLAGQSQQAIIRDKLGEIGAWAVPSNSTQTEVAGQSQRAIIRDKLGEIGAWAVPSNSTQTEVARSRSGRSFATSSRKSGRGQFLRTPRRPRSSRSRSLRLPRPSSRLAATGSIGTTRESEELSCSAPCFSGPQAW